MSSLNILTDKQSIDLALFRDSGYSLSDITLNMNLCDSFAALKENQVVAQCLIAHKINSCDITHFAYINIADFIDLLSYLFEHYKKQNLEFLEIGCGNVSVKCIWGNLQAKNS